MQSNGIFPVVVMTTAEEKTDYYGSASMIYSFHIRQSRQEDLTPAQLRTLNKLVKENLK